MTNATVRQSTANERYVKRQVSVIRVYTCSERHRTFRRKYRHKAAVVSREHRMKWVVVLGDGYQWPLPWECNVRLQMVEVFKEERWPTEARLRADYYFLREQLVYLRVYCWVLELDRILQALLMWPLKTVKQAVETGMVNQKGVKHRAFYGIRIERNLKHVCAHHWPVMCGGGSRNHFDALV